MDLQRVGVVGGGLMGSGVAEVCARAGLEVAVVEVTNELAAAGGKRVAASLDRAVAKGKLSAADRDAALGRLSCGADFGALADRDLVVEAVVEDPAVKVEIFRRLDAVVARPDAILGSNTSSIPIVRLARATRRPEQVIGLHFFSPVPVMNLVEVIPSVLTSAETLARGRAFAAEVLHKEVIQAPDRAGFIVNALLNPYTMAAIRMYEGGFATREDIDKGMMLGTNHPMGPLALCDFIGLDVVLAVAEVLYEEFKDPFYAPPPLLRRMVEGGLLGRKAGRGFYEY
ncbi:MAG: 3-hydroxybutyryl-CoA dehydrogenase [Acidimicrobiia bacterium]|nr:3-hydroxybutyryl-CoA dehydrogenase [Acidimicrobiia bacterium]